MLLLWDRVGLAWGTDENTLKDAFGSFGTVTEGIALVSFTLWFQSCGLYRIFGFG